jgi:hypothetical protein
MNANPTISPTFVVIRGLLFCCPFSIAAPIDENFFHLFVLTIALSFEGREAVQEEVKEEQEAISSSRRSKKLYLS